MVIDTLNNLEKYVSLNPLFSQVVEYLKNYDIREVASGKIEIQGKDLFVNITTAKGKSIDEAILETHKEMILQNTKD